MESKVDPVDLLFSQDHTHREKKLLVILSGLCKGVRYVPQPKTTLASGKRNDQKSSGSQSFLEKNKSREKKRVLIHYTAQILIFYSEPHCSSSQNLKF